MSDNADLEKRLADLEAGSGGATAHKKRPSPLAALGGIAAIATLGGFAYLSLQSAADTPLPTAQPAEFQAEGQGFGEIKPFVPPARPEPEIRLVEQPSEPNAELLAQLAALQAQIEALQNVPEPVVPEDTAEPDLLAGPVPFTARQVEIIRSSLETPPLATPRPPPDRDDPA